MVGYQAAIVDNMDIIVKIDGDGQMNPALIPQFVEPITSGYADYNGTRYYFCCAGCDTEFAKDPAKFAEVAKDHVQKPAAFAEKSN